MFLACLKQGNPLKILIESLNQILNEAIWDCSPSGIKFQGLFVDGPRAVFQVSVSLRADGFDPFNPPTDSISMGMNVGSLRRILRFAGNNDIITLTKAQDQGDIVTVTLKKPNEAMVAYHLEVVDRTEECWDVPEMEYASIIKMPSGEFQRIVRDLSQIGSRVVISCTMNGIKFMATDNTGHIKAIEAVNMEAVTVEMQEPVALTFASKYLKIMFSCLSNQVTLSMSPDFALVEFNVGEIGHIQYVVAPITITEKADEVWETKRDSGIIDPSSGEVQGTLDQVFKQGQAALKDIAKAIAEQTKQ